MKEKLEAASFRFGEQQGHDRPLGFATLTMGKDRPHMVPVHNLPMLLGPEHLAELRKKCSIFEKELLIVKNKKTTVNIQMKLWSLQGYLGFPEHEHDKSFYERWKSGRELSSAIPEENPEGETEMTPNRGMMRLEKGLAGEGDLRRKF